MQHARGCTREASQAKPDRVIHGNIFFLASAQWLSASLLPQSCTSLTGQPGSCMVNEWTAGPCLAISQAPCQAGTGSPPVHLAPRTVAACPPAEECLQVRNMFRSGWLVTARASAIRKKNPQNSLHLSCHIRQKDSIFSLDHICLTNVVLKPISLKNNPRCQAERYIKNYFEGEDRCSPSSARVSCIHSSSMTSKSSGCEIREKSIVVDILRCCGF